MFLQFISTFKCCLKLCLDFGRCSTITIVGSVDNVYAAQHMIQQKISQTSLVDHTKWVAFYLDGLSTDNITSGDFRLCGETRGEFVVEVPILYRVCWSYKNWRHEHNENLSSHWEFSLNYRIEKEGKVLCFD